MRQFRSYYLILSAAVLIATLALTTLPTQSSVFAQVPAADTPTTQPGETPPTPTDIPPTATSVPPTETPAPGITPATATATNTTEAPATSEPTSTPVAPPAAPVAIPEPITVVLFGTGLAALSAAAARRKNENNKSDKQ